MPLKDTKMSLEVLMRPFLTYIVVWIESTKDNFKKNFFLTFRKYQLTPNTCKSLVGRYKYLKKKILLPNQSVSEYMLEITPYKPKNHFRGPRTKSLAVPPF